MIESITRVLNQDQINLFKSKHCVICQIYSSFKICELDEGNISDVIIRCIEEGKFKPLVEKERKFLTKEDDSKDYNMH